MQRLIVHNLGPIKACDIPIKDFMVFNGAQASGKSTIAKSIFFFKNIKNVLYYLVRRLESHNDEDFIELPLGSRLKKEIRNNFLQIFGTTLAMESDMRIKFFYDDSEYLELFLKDKEGQRNFAEVYISSGIWEALATLENTMKAHLVSDVTEYKVLIDRDIFCDETEIVYIPAGRSLITLLSSQINYLYSTMDDIQKRSIDYCTQNYLERILQLKSFFTGSFEELLNNMKATTDKKINIDILKMAIDLNHSVLKGDYKNVAGEERLQIAQDHYVKINFASSGQQEALWILNVLFYYMLNNKKTFFIIEEPESHLFPSAQKSITEFIALAQKAGNKIVITTHSPYVLGSINNLLYANKISPHVNKEQLSCYIPSQLWLSFESVSAYYLENGQPECITDSDFQDINHEVIDGVSKVINEVYENMADLRHEEE